MMTVKCAEIYWSPAECLLQYRCVFCGLGFATHTECVEHLVQPCANSSLPVPDEYHTEPHFIELLCTHGFIPSQHSAPVLLEIDLQSPLDVSTTANGIETAKDYPINVEVPILSTIAEDVAEQAIISEPGQLECDICGSHCPDRAQMLFHMRRLHSGTPLDRRRNPKAATKRAAAAKPKIFCCDVCGIQMSEKGNLMVHKRIHSGERPFACGFEGCERRFISCSERTIHRRLHSGEKPYGCAECPRRFHNKNHLNTHVRSLHSEERPFECDSCQRRFKIRDVFRKHLLTHSGERPYKCAVCGNSFRQRSAYQVHMNIHSDHRPYRCGQCERGFHSSAARRSHEKVFHRMT